MTNPVIPQNLAIDQLRSGGYRDAAHALAELIDNSIQAGASEVQLLCGEARRGSGMRIAEIGVLDDGIGMDDATLQIALQLGNGTRRGATQGMGKFGMGLPMASISQVRRVEVYSWQGGGTPLFTYIDVDEISSGQMAEVPKPVRKEVPDLWLKAAGGLDESGTLVIWKNPDRLKWVRGSTVLRHSDFIVGRMYRHMLNDQSEQPVQISFKVFDLQTSTTSNKQVVSRNDPLMLVPYERLQGRWGQEAICDLQTEKSFEFEKEDGDKSTVTLRYSLAKEAARHNRDDPMPQGSRPHGKHAQKHMGVSVVRAGRELEILTDFVTDSYLDRWWGVEISFEPDLDDVFGVTNNKQSATGLAEVAHSVLKAQDAEVAEMKEVAREDGDRERLFLIDLVREVAKTKNVLLRHIRDQGRSSESAKKRRYQKEAQEKATAVGRERDKRGARTRSKATGEGLSEKESREQMRQELLEGGHTEDATQSILESYFEDNLMVEFVPEAIDSPVLFSPVPKAGRLLVKLNTKHPGYETLVSAVDMDTEGMEEKELRSSLHRASVGLRLLFASWARMEDEILDDDERDNVAQWRQSWGTYARQYLK